MKKNYISTYIKNNNTFKSFLSLLFIVGISLNSFSQVVKDFNPRSSSLTTPPNQTQYTVKGDFAMIGNTNLTLVNYSDNGTNANDMKYVDIDGDDSTWNSSSSTLTFSTENGALPGCSNIIYAGLYWSGRAGTTNIFDVTKEFLTGNTITEEVTDSNVEIKDNNSIPNTNYSLAISRSGDEDNRIITYTFVSSIASDDKVEFIYRHNDGDQTLHVSVNDGSETILLDDTVSGDNIGSDNAYLNSPYVIFSDSNYTLEVTRLKRKGEDSKDKDAKAYVNITYFETVPETTSVTKTFDKTKLLLKGPSSSNYTPITANSISGSSEINFPGTDYGRMYAGYADITDYVKQNGIGEYFVADMALVEGDGGGTGYYGGWGMVVVYENSKMGWRDITVFDGYAYVCGSCTANYEIPVNGINTKQFGDVNFKLGVISGEGDRGIEGDYFQIQKQIDGSYLTLENATGDTNNFFSSSIETGGNFRNPNLLNNTGLDIRMFNIDNPNNEIITNNQTSTKFKYGTTQDTYIIFNTTFSVDAYVPEPEGIINVSAINNISNPTNLTVLPGGEIEYTLELKNIGTEEITNTLISIPIPFTSTYIPSSIIYTENAPLVSNSAPVYVPAPAGGATGSIVWDIGTLPVPANANDILGSLTFKLLATTDCALLVNSSCGTIIPLNGIISGEGVTSGIQFDEAIFQGYVVEGVCEGEKIPTPLIVVIDSEDYVNLHCASYTPIRDFYVCNSSASSIPISNVQGEFPVGSRFYNEYPITNTSIEYTESNPFPFSSGTYFAIPPGVTICYYEFTISILEESIPPTTNNIEYCQNSVSIPLIANGDNLLWYTNSIGGIGNSTAPTPNTSIVGETTYYVTQTSENKCESERVALVVSVGIAPYAGTNGTLTLCEGTIPNESVLYNALGDAPDAGGSWTNVGLVYTYTVGATLPCTDADTSIVTV
ncbi:MAG: hypothetical protein QM495_10290, partial [Lutibacter sp.]|uniref:Ig-like domain-containing protein n=1 Tax=Lutibacter sp. TaxID=1925666 RepID=UPI00385BE07D